MLFGFILCRTWKSIVDDVKAKVIEKIDKSSTFSKSRSKETTSKLEGHSVERIPPPRPNSPL